MSSFANYNGITILISHLKPLLGIEKVAVSLASTLGGSLPVDLVCLAETKTIALDSVPRARSLGSPVRGWRRIFTLPRAWRFSRRTDGLVILAGSWAALPVLAVASRRFVQRTIVWEHSFDEHKTSNSASLRALRLIARVLYRRAAVIVVVSETLAQDVRKWCARPVVVIPNLIPSPAPAAIRARLASSREIQRIVTIGSLTTTKNQRLAIDALSHLPANCHLDIVGDGVERGRLEAQAARIGVTSRVNFYGHVDDISPLLQRSSIVAHPSLGETFGVVLFEAASAHRPVVAVAQSVMTEFVPRLVPGLLSGATSEDFARAILEVLSAPPTDDTFVVADASREAEMGIAMTVEKWTTTMRKVQLQADDAT